MIGTPAALSILLLLAGCHEASAAESRAPAPAERPAPTPAKPAQKILRVGGEVRRPVVLKRVPLDYSKVQTVRAAGVPIVEAVITEQGDVGEVRFVRSVHPKIDAVIVDSLKRWKFQPATLHGKPVPVYYTLIVNIHWQ